VIGVSVDPLEALRGFASSLKVPFAMVSDEDRRISKSYGVLWPLIGLDRRVTVLIDPEGVARGVFNHEVLATKHVDDALEALRRLPRPRASGSS
jgi:peroxiredoxin Q/BCP